MDIVCIRLTSFVYLTQRVCRFQRFGSIVCLRYAMAVACSAMRTKMYSLDAAQKTTWYGVSCRGQARKIMATNPEHSRSPDSPTMPRFILVLL